MTDVDVRETALDTELDRELDQHRVQDLADPSGRSAPDAPPRPPANPAPRLPAGTVLVDRYRLEDILAYSEPTVTWRAFDQTLSRSVLVHLLPSSDERAPRLLAAARRAAGATDSRFLRVLDAVEGARLGDDARLTSYIVCEYATGQSLQTTLADGPLTGLEAAWLVREVADALVAVHAAGLHHGRLNPDTVIITPSGNVKIVGLLIEQAMRPEGSYAPVPGGGRVDLPVAEADLLDLGRLLYASLVGRWPGGPAYGLPDAPCDGDHWFAPRQIRAGVSPALDRICQQVLGRPPRHHLTPIGTTPELVAALGRTLGPAEASGDLERRLRQQVPQVRGTDQRRTWTTAPAVRPAVTPAASGSATTTVTRAVGPDPETQPFRAVTTTPVRRHPPASPASPAGAPAGSALPPRQPRRWIAVLIALVVLIVVAALVIGLDPGGSRNADPGTQPSSTPSATAPAGGPVRIATARDFDPQGTDARPPRENPSQVPLAYDGDPATRWTTVTYQGNPKLGGIKRGVGLILDLGSPQPVSAVGLRLSGTGTSLQIRVPEGDAATVSSPDLSSDSGWRTVGSAAKVGGTTTVSLGSPVTTRYVLVYLTSLPKEGSGYRGGIYEVEVRA